MLDAADAEALSGEFRFKRAGKKDRHNPSYYLCVVDRNEKRHQAHRVLLGVTDPKILVDHRNGDGLDCRRGNMRLATYAQNCANSRVRATSMTGFKGVRSDSRRPGLWRAAIGKRPTKYLGWFKTPEDAARAYDKAARERWGEFALCNFSDAT